VIAPCTCQHADQDKIYGKGMRLFNERANPDKPPRCTVCRAEHKSAGAPKKGK
jgi:hypothetical protein